HSYRITAGTEEKQLSFYMKLFTPKKRAPWPTAVDGDLCFMYAFDTPWHEAFTENGFALAMFDRTEIMHDIYGEDRMKSPLCEIYPEYTFGALGAWAWGYKRVTDALIMLGLLDPECLAYTGHSRGGKTALLAGVLDERANIVAPNETNAGAAGCYRIHMRAIQENGLEARSETLRDLVTAFPFWLGPEMAAYQEREEELPFDCHFLKSLVAPRILLIGEAASDIWTNPIGSWQTTMAAKEVYDFLGASDNLYWYFRRGYHFHTLEDVMHLVELMRRKVMPVRTPLNNRFFETPFRQPELIFNWKAPGKK
ncbi:MAG: hypothetical protein IKR59_10065, partial [Lachnospiraceae bacterium]|nr:hypothetical protein [Lachnospiraceae bacterium]